jgi:hypothetical protein
VDVGGRGLVREWGGCKVCRATVGEEGAGLDRWVVIEYVCATA